MSADTHVFFNGEILAGSAARLSPLDRGLLYGDGVFDTMRVYRGQTFARALHLDRLYRSLAALRISVPESPAELGAAVDQVIEANGGGDCVVRTTISRGPVPGSLGLPETSAATRLIQVRELPLLTAELHHEGVSAIVSSVPFGRSPALQGHKTLNYLDSLWAKQEAYDSNAFEAVLLGPGGEVVEGASSNLFVAMGERAITPPLSDGALPGITRAICIGLLATADIAVDERSLSLADLHAADELLLTNSVSEIVPAVTLDGRPIGIGAPGPLARLLSAAYCQRVDREISGG